MNVAVITDSASSLPHDELQRLGIGVVPLYVRDGETTLPETEIDLPSFYERLADTRVLPTTSQPSPEDFIEAMEPVVAEGADVLGVFISSKMSGTIRAATIATDMLKSRYPHVRIETVDSESNSMQEGFAVLAAAESAAAGARIEECVQAARRSIARSRFLFAPHSLEYLARGGRISGARALLGSALKITPIITASHGEAAAAGAARTQNKALRRIAALMQADVARFGLGRAVVQGVADLEGAARFARDLIEPIVGKRVDVVPVPATVGVHVGPAIGVAYETLDAMR